MRKPRRTCTDNWSWGKKKPAPAREESNVITLPFRGDRRGSLVAMRRVLALEGEDPRIIIECYGDGPGEAYQVRWTGEGAFPEEARAKVAAALEGVQEPTQGALL